MSLANRLRHEVLERDGSRCIECGRAAPAVELTVLYITPIEQGGTADPANLVSVCTECAAGAADVDPASRLPKLDAEARRWIRAMRVGTRMLQQERARLADDVAAVDAAWCSWHFDKTQEEIPRPDNWRRDVEYYLTTGLSVEEMVRLVPIAVQAHTIPNLNFAKWLYYRGCCRNTLAQVQTIARRLIDARDPSLDVPGLTDDEYRQPTLEDLP